LNVIVALIASYLLGAFSTSYLVGRAQGLDLREQGSGNLGATNAYRVLGAPSGLLVLPVDILKGFIPVWYFPGWDGSATPEWAYAYGALAIAGHVWPVFTAFRGGKGVATAAGVLFALAPVASLAGFMIWLGMLLVTRTSSVASLLAATAVPLVAYIAAAPPFTVLFAVGASAVVWWTHRGNLRRLRRGDELPLELHARGGGRRSS
jgi:glycerol-3-phosphate acyltransferase PlsY